MKYYYKKEKSNIIIKMKCKACKGEEFTKSKSGFLTCRT